VEKFTENFQIRYKGRCESDLVSLCTSSHLPFPPPLPLTEENTCVGVGGGTGINSHSHFSKAFLLITLSRSLRVVIQ